MIEHEKASTDEEKKEKKQTHTHQSDLLNNRALGV